MFRQGQDLLPSFNPSSGLPPRAPPPPPRAPPPPPSGMLMNIGAPQYTQPLPPPVVLPTGSFVLGPYATTGPPPPPPSRFPLPFPMVVASGQSLQPSTHHPPQPLMQQSPLMQPPPQPPPLPPPQAPLHSSSSVQPSSQSFISPHQHPMQPPQPHMQPLQQPPFIPPLPGSPPADVPPPPPSGPPPQPPPPPPPPPLAEGLEQSIANPPRMPSDSEVVKNIEVLAAFVVRNGPEFELMARAKQAGDPKFAFLFGNDPGTEAAIGHEYYKWKKQVFKSQMQKETEGNANTRLESGKSSEPPLGDNNMAGKSVAPKVVPSSPTVSDMDMDDDFASPSPKKENSCERQLKDSRSASMENLREATAISIESIDYGDMQLDRSRSVFEKGFRELTSSSMEVVDKPKVVFEESIRDHPTNRVEAVDLQLPYSEEDDSDEDQIKEPGVGIELVEDVAMPSPEEEASDERQLKEATPVPEEDIRDFALASPKEMLGSPKEPLGSPKEPLASSEESLASSKECLAYPKEDLPSPKVALASPKESSVERQFRDPGARSEEDNREEIQELRVNRMGESFSRMSRWGPPPQPLEDVRVSSDKFELVNKELPTEAFEKRERLRDSSFSPDLHYNERRDTLGDWDRRSTVDKIGETDSDIRRSEDDRGRRDDQEVVAVDEFGRIKRQGSDESDFDGDPWKSIRSRSYSRSSSRSRSRSRSPGEFRWRRRSVSRSPRRWGRRSRSYSRSPRSRNHRSRTPPRDSRWMPFGPSEPLGRGDLHERGRRGGRGPSQHVCFDFIRGKCFRGAACRYLHQENVEAIGDSGGRWALGNRNRGWREAGADRERSWTTRSVTPPLAVVEAMAEGENILKENEAASEPRDEPEPKNQCLSPEEEKRVEVADFDKDESDKLASPGKGIKEELKVSDNVDRPAKSSSPPSLSQDIGSPPKKPSPEPPLPLDQPPPMVTADQPPPMVTADQPPPMVTSVPSPPSVTLQPSSSSVHVTTPIGQHISPGNSLLQPRMPRVPAMSRRIPMLNFQHPLPTGQSASAGSCALPQPISIHQPVFENLQPFQQPHQPPSMGNSVFSQGHPFSANSLPPRSTLFAKHPQPFQPVYQVSIPQPGMVTNLPQQHMPGPNLAVPQQYMSGPNLAGPRQHVPGFNLTAPQQHISGPNLAPPQHISGPNLAVQQQHLPGPNLSIPLQHISGPNLAMPPQHNFPVAPSPTNFLGHETRFQQHGAMPTVATPAMHSLGPLEQRFNSLPERGFSSLSERGPKLGFNPLPDRGIRSPPELFNPFPEQGLRSMPTTSIQASFPRPFIGDASSQFTFPHLMKAGFQSVAMSSSVSQKPPPVGMSWLGAVPSSMHAHTGLIQPSPPPRTAQAPSMNYLLPGVSTGMGWLPVQPKPVSLNSTAGEQYDPLADSIEPVPTSGLLPWTKPLLSNSDTQADIVRDHQIFDKYRDQFGAIRLKMPMPLPSDNVATKLMGADETAALGVGIVENVSPPDDNRTWSPGQPVEGATGTGEVETGLEQVQSKLKKNKEKNKDKSKEKSKEGRGLKLLRAAVAEYVKEVLKPTWREGQMSKEAFKTIAKKAVEKVTGNLPSHHIPKSQEKVDQYMLSSRTKIDKLVQGYVDKYLKT